MSTLKTAPRKGLTRPKKVKNTVITPFTPSMPDVNLLPPRVFEAVHAKQAQRKLALIGAALLLVGAGAYLGQTAQILSANNALDAEVANGVVLQKQVRALTPVKAFYGGVSAQKLAVQKTMAQELFFSKVSTELLKDAPAGVTISTVTIAASESGAAGATAAAGSSCPSANPFSPSPIVACVQFTGTAPAREGVSALLVSLIASQNFANAYIPVTDSAGAAATGAAGAAAGPTQVTFNGSVGVTDKFFSNRYANDAYLLKGAGAAK